MSRLIKHLTTSIVTISFLISLIGLQSVFAQTKFDEYENIKIDDERYRVVTLLDYLAKNPETRALFAVHAKEDEAGFGNVLGYLEGVEKYISNKNFDLSRIDFAVAKGKETFTKEIWIIEKGENQPQLELLEYDFADLKENYLYGSVCFLCEPPYEEFTRTQIDFTHLSQILKQNSNYSILLKIGKDSTDSERTVSAKEYARKIKKLLATEYKINKKRFRYEIIKDSRKVEFYIIPTNK